MAVVAGVDFGTQSVRVALVDSERGPIGAGTAEYPVNRDRRDPDFATQSHAAHMDALALATQRALADAKRRWRRRSKPSRSIRPVRPSFRWTSISRRSTTTTSGRPSRERRGGAHHRGGTPRETAGDRDVRRRLLVGVGIRQAAPLAAPQPGQARALRDGARALRHGRGGALRRSPSAENVPRSVCAMGHKWLWSESNRRFTTRGVSHLGGSAARRRSREAWRALSHLRPHRRPAERRVGRVGSDCARGFRFRSARSTPTGTPIGAGIQEGDVVNVVGTSTCIIAIAKQADCVPGVCGVVPGSVHPDYVGVEAGLSAVGDIFEAIARARRHDCPSALERSRGLPGRPDGASPPHLGQRRPHGAREPEPRRRHARLESEPRRARRAVRGDRGHGAPYAHHFRADGRARRADSPRDQRAAGFRRRTTC